jgi:heme-degrading monooxygenase HmoA
MFRSRLLSSVKVVMIRNWKPHSLGKEGFKALLEIKQLALTKPGFLSSEVNTNVNDYHDQLIISNWENMESWIAFRDDTERQRLHKIITASLVTPEDVRVYSGSAVSVSERSLEENIQNLRGASHGETYTKRRLDD